MILYSLDNKIIEMFYLNRFVMFFNGVLEDLMIHLLFYSF